MTVTKPYITTPVVGAKITAAGFGTEVVNDVAYFNNTPRVSLITPTNTTLATASAALLWSAEEYDTHGMHSTSVNTSRVNILISGTYALETLVRASASSNDTLTIDWRQNAAGVSGAGTQLAGGQFVLTGAGAQVGYVRKTVDLVSGDHVEVFTNKAQPATTTTISATAAFTYAQVTLVAYA